MVPKPEKLKGASALFASAFIYATFGGLIRQMAVMFGDSTQTAVRFGLAFVFIALLNLIRKNSFTLPKQALIKACLLGISFGVVVLLFTVSINNTKIANSVFLLYAGSLISSLLIGTFILKEKLNLVKIIAIALAFLGLYMYSEAFFVMSLGVVTGFLCGIFDGISNAIRKSLSGINRNTILFYQLAISALFAGGAIIFFQETMIKEFSFLAIIAVVIFALLQIGLGNLLLYGFEHFDVNIGTVILATELVFATILSFFFFKEIPTSKELLGGALIFMASILSAVDLKQLLSKSKSL